MKVPFFCLFFYWGGGGGRGRKQIRGERDLYLAVMEHEPKKTSRRGGITGKDRSKGSSNYVLNMGTSLVIKTVGQTFRTGIGGSSYLVYNQNDEK